MVTHLHCIQAEHTLIEVKVVARNVSITEVRIYNGYLLIALLELLFLIFFCHI
jgi:hypothetical protein